MSKPGTVYLVGAGPGDPDLITVKGLRCLEQADVVVYDRLSSPDLLRHVRADAERVFMGKEPSTPGEFQQAINQALVDAAQAGKMVVRLKGGDPFVFGRGGEELLALREAGIPFQVVPGVTSAVAVPAYAGIPITHRGAATAFTVVSGSEDPTKPETDLDWPALAATPGTLVVLMGWRRLEAGKHIMCRGKGGLNDQHVYIYIYKYICTWYTCTHLYTYIYIYIYMYLYMATFHYFLKRTMYDKG